MSASLPIAIVAKWGSAPTKSGHEAIHTLNVLAKVPDKSDLVLSLLCEQENGIF
jgi:hypothetical protein